MQNIIALATANAISYIGNIYSMQLEVFTIYIILYASIWFVLTIIVMGGLQPAIKVNCCMHFSNYTKSYNIILIHPPHVPLADVHVYIYTYIPIHICIYIKWVYRP